MIKNCQMNSAVVLNIPCEDGTDDKTDKTVTCSPAGGGHDTNAGATKPR